jgi:hypothetical protein
MAFLRRNPVVLAGSAAVTRAPVRAGGQDDALFCDLRCGPRQVSDSVTVVVGLLQR